MDDITIQWILNLNLTWKETDENQALLTVVSSTNDLFRLTGLAKISTLPSQPSPNGRDDSDLEVT